MVQLTIKPGCLDCAQEELRVLQTYVSTAHSSLSSAVSEFGTSKAITGMVEHGLAAPLNL